MLEQLVLPDEVGEDASRDESLFVDEVLEGDGVPARAS